MMSTPSDVPHMLLVTPVEVNTFYDDLIATGPDLGVSMPAMESYADAIRQFAE